MSKYTVELRFVVEQALDELGLAHSEGNWPEIYGAVGLSDYPIYERAHRNVLNNMIIRHYYTRELCAETVGRWRMFARAAMHEIMPYYNQLYESAAAAAGIDMLSDKGRKTVEKAWGDAANQAKTSAESQSVFSDTPQSEMIPAQIKEMRYATNVTLDENGGTSESNGEYRNQLERLETGFTRSQAENLIKFRESILNIDRSIVEDEEIRELFMAIW